MFVARLPRDCGARRLPSYSQTCEVGRFPARKEAERARPSDGMTGNLISAWRFPFVFTYSLFNQCFKFLYQTLALFEILFRVFYCGIIVCRHCLFVCLFACLGFNSTFSTNRLYRTIKVGNVSHRAKGEHKYHVLKQWKNTINQHNHKLSSAWATIPSPSPLLGFLRGVFRLSIGK